MARRAHTPVLRVGQIALDPAQSHHVRDVLRLSPGDELELFDDAGATARAKILHGADSGRPEPSGRVIVRVTAVRPPTRQPLELTIAAALPKGPRADWMVEKLGELGVVRFVPLIADRSVVQPAGANKLQRWQRLAQQAARQSHRSGVMRIAPALSTDALLATIGAERLFAAYLAPLPDARPIAAIAAPARAAAGGAVLLAVGPEGGWTDREAEAFGAAGLTPVRLTGTILRIETAAIAAAAVILSLADAHTDTPGMPGPADGVGQHSDGKVE